jgi:hypothetical protein
VDDHVSDAYLAAWAAGVDRAHANSFVLERDLDALRARRRVMTAARG